MNKYELTKTKVNDLIKKEYKYDFPHFLSNLRECFGLTRRTVCKEICFPEGKLFHLENGMFRTHVDTNEIEQLAEYYEVDSDLLISKADEFISEGKGIPQHKRSYYVKRCTCNNRK